MTLLGLAIRVAHIAAVDHDLISLLSHGFIRMLYWEPKETVLMVVRV